MATAALLAAGFALVFFYAPTTPTRASSRRSSTCTCRSRSARWSGSSWPRSTRSGTCEAATPSTTPAPTSPSTCRSSSASASCSPASIWARASWGKWWVWDEPTLVSFLIVFLLYATYYPLRYAIEDRERQARYASVFAITAGAFVPLNFLAVRAAESLVHPRMFATANGGLPGAMMLTFLVSLAGMALLWLTLVRFELAAKSVSARISRLRRALEAEAPSTGAHGSRRPCPRARRRPGSP